MADVLLLGMGPTALSALDSLAAKLNVLGIVRVRASECQSVDPVVDRAQELGIPVFSDISLAAVGALISQLKPDCVVVSSYNRLLPPKLTAQCPFINVHYAPLPRYRGRANVNWALINGESWAAITIHTVVPELDAGNILFQQCIPIRDTDTITALYEKLNDIQRQHLAGTIVHFLYGYEGIPQDNREATYGCSRVPEDGEIDWTASTSKICDLVRALVAPFPGAYTYLHGKRLMVWKARPVDNPPYYAGRIPGRIIRTSRTEGYVEVLTGDGILRILEVQFQGESPTAAANVIKSVRETLGLRTADLLERIQSLEQQMAKLMEMSQGSQEYAE